ncbi:GNAT family N-acetyltransferase [Arthrobacter sp. H35-D1]|uniref:GNAT family N-acetyltransferase n=1 Tax=Arthrobacter sp. H35-D1 TaxID=3046202 RepID=UPI0024B9AD1C|nr:GNAT family N-acetyltransferase [Arthrobacter sp. H35-D1]MDJ0312892.1 GNAT family N-acetyltransferase [Arthrobacter sp. H35-D1]
MTFDLASAPIVLLAWERGLGLPANSLLVGTAKGRITHAVDSPELTFIRLWEQSILVGPQHLLDAAEAYDDDELSDHSTMLRITRYDGGRGLGTQGLYYADDLDVLQPVHTVHVATGPEPAAALESLCPPDDINDVALSVLEHKFTVMDSGTPDAGPVACSAYTEYQGLLAQMGTLVVPEFRRQGAGRLATSIAAQEALAAGLIVQWRADINNSAAHALATSMGFNVAGLQTQVALQAR